MVVPTAPVTNLALDVERIVRSGLETALQSVGFTFQGIPIRGTRPIRGSPEEISSLFRFGYDVVERRNEDPRRDDPSNHTD
jgi:hypothetical protein